MFDMEQWIYERIAPQIRTWRAPTAYAVSFYVYANLSYTYLKYYNLTEISVGYVTEEDVGPEPVSGEDRWNMMAANRRVEKAIVMPDNPEDMEILFAWYADMGVDIAAMGQYSADNLVTKQYAIPYGKEPIGFTELIEAMISVARRIRQEGIIEEAFGKPLPIIIHGLEMYGLYINATLLANPSGEAHQYFDYVISEGFQQGENGLYYYPKR